jgi:hypothetical protein
MLIKYARKSGWTDRTGKADDGVMFLTDCHSCGLRELRGPRSIELLVNTGRAAGGIDLVYRCTRCGTSNVLGASPAAPAYPAASAA